MAPSAEEMRDLRAILVLFFPAERGAIVTNDPNEETLSLTEAFLIETDKCTRAMQQFIADLGAGLTRGFLRKVLRHLGKDAANPDGFLRGNVPCTNFGRAAYKNRIMISFTV